MKITRESLLEKGWTEEEVEKTLGMVYSPEKEEKHIEYKKEMNKTVYWAVLLVLTLSNFLISVILIPFLLVLKPLHIGIISAIFGFIFGLLFNLVVLDIEHIERRHHIMAAVFIPAVALINVFVTVTIANSMAERVGLPGHEDPIFISMLYITAFLAPYVFSQFMEATSKWKKIETRERSSKK